MNEPTEASPQPQAAAGPEASPVFFRCPAELRAWFHANHTTACQIWVGYYKKATGQPSVTWPESVDEALCVGWIDGIRKRLDERAYVIRFTPRRPSSSWSAINIRRVQALTKEGRMLPAGLNAFALRREGKARGPSNEPRPSQLPEPYLSLLRQNAAAWDCFQKQPPSCRRVSAGWVISAKREETRLRRLQHLISLAAQGRRLL